MMKTLWSAIFITFSVTFGQAQAENILLNCEHTNGKRPKNFELEISDDRVLYDGKKIDAESIAVGQNYITFSVIYHFPGLAIKNDYKIDRNTGSLKFTATYLSDLHTEFEASLCKKNEVTPRKF